MFKDRDEALKQMNDALWEENDPEEILEEYEEEYDDLLEEDVYSNHIAGEDLELYSQELSKSPKGGITGLALTCIGLMAAILAVLIYWALRFGG